MVVVVVVVASVVAVVQLGSCGDRWWLSGAQWRLHGVVAVVVAQWWSSAAVAR